MEVSSIIEQLLFTTVRIETVDAFNNQSMGTGFLFGYRAGGNSYPFIVTNKHVVQDAHKGAFTFIKGKDGKPLLGQGFRVGVDNFQNGWFGHPEAEIDVIVASLVPALAPFEAAGESFYYRLIDSNWTASSESLSKLSALEEIIFIGYPNGIWDRLNLLPIIRKGITASPIAVDFQGSKQFLIDASVFPGSSGSPVFLYNQGMYYEKSSGTIVGSRLLFLGVVASVYFQEDLNEIRYIPQPALDVPTALSKQMIDLGIVYKSSTIIETIELFLKQRGEIT